MKLSTHTIPDSGKQLDFELPPAELLTALPTDDRLRTAIVEPLKARLFAEKLNQTVRLESSSAIMLRPECDRCLEPFPLIVDLSFNATCVPNQMLREEDEGVIPYSGDEIDLSEILREQVFAVLPMVFICKQDCLGLCKQCGANLNQGICRCKLPQ